MCANPDTDTCTFYVLFKTLWRHLQQGTHVIVPLHPVLEACDLGYLTTRCLSSAAPRQQSIFDPSGYSSLPVQAMSVKDSVMVIKIRSFESYEWALYEWVLMCENKICNPGGFSSQHFTLHVQVSPITRGLKKHSPCLLSHFFLEFTA